MTRDTSDPNKVGGGRDARSSAKLTEETATAVVGAIRAGNYIETAAAYAGVHRDTLYTWMRKGRQATEGPYFEFVQEIEQALAAAEVRDLALIGQAAVEQWQAAAWRLERRYPDKYGRRQRIDHGNADGQPLAVTAAPYIDLSKLTDEEIEAAKRILEKARPDALPDNVRQLPRAVEG